MAFTLIRPFTVTQAALLSCDVAETVAAWNIGTTYASGATIRFDAAEGSRLYESLTDGNIGNAVTDTDHWQDMGPTNRWRALDTSPTSQTLNDDSVTYEVAVTGYADSVVVQNVDAATVRVEQTSMLDGVVYDETFSLVSNNGILNYYDWQFEPIERVTKKAIFGLKPYANSTVKVTIAAPGGLVRVGQVTIGQSRKFGGTKWGGTVGIQDYSRKGEDDFGNSVPIERAFSDIAGFAVWIDAGFFDQMCVLLARYRATPIVWIGDERFASTIIYGWPEDWRGELTEGDKKLLSINFVGLT